MQTMNGNLAATASSKHTIPTDLRVQLHEKHELKFEALNEKWDEIK